MKSFSLELFSLICLFLLLSSCNEEEETETPFCSNGDFCLQIGSEQFNSNARYYTAGVDGVYGVSSALDTTFTHDVSINFHSDNHLGGTFNFMSSIIPLNGAASLLYRVGSQTFMASSGSVTVTSVSDSFASGVFFATVNVNGNNVEISNGNFVNVHE